MTEPRLSTSSSNPSDAALEKQRLHKRLFQVRTLSIAKTLGWTAVWLTLIDFAVNLFFPYPQASSPNSLQQYFDYGRSIEGKLNRMVGTSTATSAPIVEAGWIDPQAWRNLPTAPEEGKDLLVSVYGMSFSNHASEAMAELDGRTTLRKIGGPAAPPNHSFAAFSEDSQGRSAQVAILAILASSVQHMCTVSGMNWTYEHPAPYTYPRYTVQNGALTVMEPTISTLPQFREAFLRRNEDWQVLLASMKAQDCSFNSFVFDDIGDRSAMIRLFRRAWANRIQDNVDNNLYSPTEGFNPEAPEIAALKAIAAEFSQAARNSGQVPLILLINNQGYSDHLYQALTKRLNTVDALVVSTHTVVSPNDPRNFLGDGHFTHEANLKIGEELRQTIREALR